MAFKPFFEVDLPRGYSPLERDAIAAEIISLVINRTEKGIDKDGDRFPKYSKQYAAIKGQSSVDLRLTGEMLENLEILQSKATKLRIGYDKSAEVTGRVEGNVTGSYGRDPNPSKARDFLGIQQKDIDKILDNYPIEDKQERRQRAIDVASGEIVSDDILELIEFDI